MNNVIKVITKNCWSLNGKARSGSVENMRGVQNGFRTIRHYFTTGFCESAGV